MDSLIDGYLHDIEELMRRLPVDEIRRLVDLLYDAYQGDRQIFSMGNGGGAATTSHFTCDLSKGTIVEGRPRVRAISLSDNAPLMTAWANDTDYTNIFGEQLANLARPDDVLIGLTANGLSPNINNAMLLANERGLETVALVGHDGGTVKQVAKHCLIIPSDDNNHIEDVQMLLLHMAAMRGFGPAA